jgi:hypothetical protein
MASSGYTAWSVVAGETPTTTKWNLLGSNDASFNTGQGLNDSAIITRHLAPGVAPFGVAYNPCKFSVGRNAAYSLGAGQTAVVFDTVDYDTGINYSTSNGRFVCTVPGWYHFDSSVSSVITAGSVVFIAILRNGGEVRRGDRSNNAPSGNYYSISADLKLVVGDYVQIGMYGSIAWSVEAGSARTGLMED